MGLGEYLKVNAFFAAIAFIRKKNELNCKMRHNKL